MNPEPNPVTPVSESPVGDARMTKARSQLEELEANALNRLRHVLVGLQQRLSQTDAVLGSASTADWTIRSMSRRVVEALDHRGRFVERADGAPAQAIVALARMTRTPVQALARDIDRMLSLLEPHPGGATERRSEPASEAPSQPSRSGERVGT